jgi:ADP-ribosylglycohydrolase
LNGLKDRALGSMLGLAVGDALGVTLEFEALPPKPWSPLLSGPHTNIRGGGPFGWVLGQVSDDTHMACALAGSLQEVGRYDTADALRRYKAWLDLRPPDAGSLTRRIVPRGVRSGTPFEEARADWEATGRTNAPNGSLMRTAPIGVFFWNDAEALRAASLDDSAATHFDPRCQLACAVFNAGIAAAVAAARAPREVFDAATLELPRAAEEAAERYFPDDRGLVQKAAASLQADLQAAAQDDPDLYGSKLHITRTEGFVRVAFRLAFWELLHAPTFDEGLLDAVNRGGDADTNGAIAGALLGACHGAEAIPARWVEPVLAAAPSVGGGGGDPAYHPKALVRFVEKCFGK